jgi:putative component of toxin-antitoxin plasmid stabilization module
MFEVRQTPEFRDWLKGLKNVRMGEIVAIRIARV